MISCKCVGKTILYCLCLAFLLLTSAPAGFAQTGTWSEPVNISHTSNGSWFPDLAVDSLGNVHVVWCETTAVTRGHLEQVYYSMYNGQTWSEPSDIVPPSEDIIRNAIAADRDGNLHMLFGGSAVNVLSMSYQKAPAVKARAASSWSAPHRLNQGNGYMGDIAVDSKGTIHVIYDDIVCAGGMELQSCYSDIFYRRSPDGGQTWSYPLNLFRSPATGSSHPQMEIDGHDTIHVAWDEGWDRLTGDGNPLYSGYTFSTDGGETWEPAIYLTYPQSPTQITVGGDDRGGVMLVWRATSRPEFFYQWSADGGRSWLPPQVIPGILARPGQQGLHFDMYDMAADSAGRIHLVVVGREDLVEEAPLGVYHLTWEGKSWSEAEKIYSGARLYPEYTKIVIGRDNRLHTVWFTREDSWEDGIREVWYSGNQPDGLPPASTTSASSPPPASTPAPTLTQTPTPTPRLRPTATPYPTLLSGTTGLPAGLYTESDELLELAIALGPALLLTGGVIIIRLGGRKFFP